jgi:hypothetical protein
VNNDKKLFKWLLALISLPILLAFFGGDRYRYPCQDPANWDKDLCQKPLCEVHRQCPDLIFKGNDSLIQAAREKGIKK